jgi:hypothetical protein
VLNPFPRPPFLLKVIKNKNESFVCVRVCDDECLSRGNGIVGHAHPITLPQSPSPLFFFQYYLPLQLYRKMLDNKREIGF